MKIVLDKRIPGLKEALYAFPGNEILEKEGSEISASAVRDADVLFVRTRTHCDANLLGDSKVKLIGTATIGTDHVDIPWCKKKGISVVNAPGCNAPAVMQYVASSLHKAGFIPGEHTLGIIGKGNIGSRVADLYRKAGCRVLVCDPPRKDAGMLDEDYVGLDFLLNNSDAITVHVPYTKKGPYATHHLLPGELPGNVRFLVNASRGGVVHPGIFASDSLRLIIDTWPFEDEPSAFSEEEINQMVSKAFISTPHIAGYSIEGKMRATESMISAFKNFQGLASSDVEPYVPKGLDYSLPDVINSFDPLATSRALKASPTDFERLRSAHLRPEPPVLNNSLIQ